MSEPLRRRKNGTQSLFLAAKRRKNAAHRASGGYFVEDKLAPTGRKKSYDTDSEGSRQVLAHALEPVRPAVFQHTMDEIRSSYLMGFLIFA